MIEASDIRVGNLLWYYDYHMTETVFRVEGIHEGYIFNTGLPRSRLPLEKANPIQLDVSYLFQFGFLAGDRDYGEDPDIYTYKYNRTDSIYIRDEGDKFQPLAAHEGGFAPYGKPVIHLHQLQNLFYDLTREDVFMQ